MLQRRIESFSHTDWRFQAYAYIFSTIGQIAVLVRELFLKYRYITSASLEYKFKCFSLYVKEFKCCWEK
jgi:hypothetical protein